MQLKGSCVSRGELTAEALWYVGAGRTEIRQERVNPLAEGMVRVRARYGGISRGTEALIAAGKVPSSEYQRMRSPHMGGSFPFPVKYGYSTVGRVEAGPDGLVGRDVFALHPHQTMFDVPVDAALPVPTDVPISRAVLAANMETALNATWDADPLPSGPIAVVGAGVVGALVGFLCARERGAEVTLIDINPARAELARTLGLNFADTERCAGRLRTGGAHQRRSAGACHCARHRGRRSDDPGNELVRRRHRAGATGWRLSQPPPQDRVEPSGQGGAIAPRNHVASATAAAGDRAAGRRAAGRLADARSTVPRTP